MRWNFSIDVIEHDTYIQLWTLGHGAVGDGFLPCFINEGLVFLSQRFVLFFRPVAGVDQVLLKTFDRVA